MQRNGRWPATLVTWALLGTAAGCSSWGTFCSDRMECLEGNDADVDACELGFDAEEERASIEGCDDTWDALAECLQDKSDCRGDHLWNDQKACDKQGADYQECMQ